MAITTDDFNKIWASTSPLTPYSFSASQYKEGWNFIGSTPPSRQMWDFLQKNNDEKMQYLLNHAESTYATKTEAGVPIGFEYFSMNPNVPEGSLPLLGGEYSRTTYADLWAWVQTQNGYLLEESAWQAKAAANGGNVPFYSKGDGSTTFRVPALKCWVRGANSISEVGGYLAAGLPNITGDSASIMWKDSVANNGAYVFREDVAGREMAIPDNGGWDYFISSFDASRSSAIYGKSTTVQPESIVGMWVVKAYGTVTNVGSTDVANISTGLTQAETRISALENHGAAAVGSIQAFAGNSLPNGWLLCDGSAVSRTDYAALYAVIGTTYGAGNGSTTFNLPNLIDKFVEGSATAGTVKSAGLPNITGEMYNQAGSMTVTDQSAGAFKDTNPPGVVLAGASSGGYGYGRTTTFDASRSSSVYGGSSTVQPPALTMRYIIKY